MSLRNQLLQPARSSIVVVSLGLCAAMVGCGSSSTASNPGASNSGPNSPIAVAGGDAVDIHVVVTGGPTPGTFDVKSDKACQVAMSAKTWNAGYAGDINATTGLSVFNFGVDASKNPALITVAVIANGYGSFQYNVSTIVPELAKGSSGTATVNDHGGNSADFTFQSKTGEGYEVDGTVKCHQIIRG